MKSSRETMSVRQRKFRGHDVRRFLRACEQGRLADVKRLLSEGHDPNGHDDVLGDRPLHVVARTGHVPVASALLAAGADIEALVGYNGVDRPLDCAAEKGQVQMVRFLLSRGARLNIRGNSRALLSAVRAGQLATTVLLLRKGARLAKDALYWAVRTGDVRLAQLLLKAGANVKGAGSDGKPIRAAARLHGGGEMIKMLVRHGADLHTKSDEDGATLLHMVYNEDSALFLIDCGLDVHATDRFGTTPLHHCASRGFVRACRLLLDKGADPRAKTRRGFTPRQMSEFRGRGPVYELLTEKLRQTSAAKKRIAPTTTMDGCRTKRCTE